MLKFSVYYHDESETVSVIQRILIYAREKYLFVWRIDTENDAQYIELSKPDNFAVHAYLLTETELGHFLHEQQAAHDDIPF